MGAGKSTIAGALSDQFGWPRVSFGDYVREVARSRGVEESRNALQELGESMVQADAQKFTAAVLSGVNLRSGAVIDGIRHMEVLQIIKNLVAPLPVFLVYVETEEKVRMQRLMQRGMTVDAINSADGHSTEVQVRSLLRESAVLQVRGDRDPAEAVSLISEWVNTNAGSQ